MTDDVEHDQRTPYEPPAVRALGPVAEVTRGAGTNTLGDLYLASV
jgi:hypothetical protein